MDSLDTENKARTLFQLLCDFGFFESTGGVMCFTLCDWSIEWKTSGAMKWRTEAYLANQKGIMASSIIYPNGKLTVIQVANLVPATAQANLC